MRAAGLVLGARASRPQSRAYARRTLILAFSHKGRRDPLVAIHDWFRMASLTAIVWIPAFAGMTGVEWEMGIRAD